MLKYRLMSSSLQLDDGCKEFRMILFGCEDIYMEYNETIQGPWSGNCMSMQLVEKKDMRAHHIHFTFSHKPLPAPQFAQTCKPTFTSILIRNKGWISDKFYHHKVSVIGLKLKICHHLRLLLSPLLALLIKMIDSTKKKARHTRSVHLKRPLLAKDPQFIWESFLVKRAYIHNRAVYLLTTRFQEFWESLSVRSEPSLWMFLNCKSESAYYFQHKMSVFRYVDYIRSNFWQ